MKHKRAGKTTAKDWNLESFHEKWHSSLRFLAVCSLKLPALPFRNFVSEPLYDPVSKKEIRNNHANENHSIAIKQMTWKNCDEIGHTQAEEQKKFWLTKKYKQKLQTVDEKSTVIV